jgi:inosose dehydratase
MLFMKTHSTRRTFLAGLGAAATVTSMPSFAVPSIRGISFGYAAITWGNEERQAVDDIAAVGFGAYSFALTL